MPSFDEPVAATTLLSYSMFVDGGAEQVCKQIQSGSLSSAEKVDLQASRIGDVEASKIAEALRDSLPENLAKLRVLNLRGNRIGDLGASALAQALRSTPGLMPKLKELNLRGNQIGIDGINALASVLRERPEVLGKHEPRRYRTCG